MEIGSVHDHIDPNNPVCDHAVLLVPRKDLFLNEALGALAARALTYLQAGVPVHFRGPAGTGKTTLALQLAAGLGRPAILMTGDGWMTAGDLVGKETGVSHRQVVDNFVHNVRKTSTESAAIWSEDRLTAAIENGFTLVYDEFTRSPPRANNPLLMALEERMVILPQRSRAKIYVKAHPEFRVIFTSNPEDYAGVSAPQDALLDRMITFDLDRHARETEIGIVANRSGLDPEACAVIVDIVRKVREEAGAAPGSLRAGIMIAKVVRQLGIAASHQEPQFVQLCIDVLHARRAGERDSDRQERDKGLAQLTRQVQRLTSPRPRASVA